MNWAFALLGVRADVDVAGVKRAYARLLRTTRPDEDAEAFQQLHKAYQLVLAHAKAQQSDSVAPASDFSSAPSAAESADGTPAARAAAPTATIARATEPIDAPTMAKPPTPALETTPVVNPHDLANKIIQHAVDTADVPALERWLSSQPEFWSIRIKQQSGQLVLQQLFRDPQPMAPSHLDVLLQFFDLQQVLSGVNPLALARLRQRQLALWYMLPKNERALATRLNIPTEKSPNPATAQALLHQLSAPLRWQNVASTIYRGRSKIIARLIHGLCGGQLDNLPASIDRRQAEFWHRATQLNRPSWPRFIVGSMRSAFLSMILLLGIVVVCGFASNDMSSGEVALLAVAMATAAFCIWLAYAGWTWLDYWQRLPESAHPMMIWLCRALIPVLCMISLITNYLLHAPVIAIFVIAPTLVLMLRRYFHRNPMHNKFRKLFNGRGLFVALFLLANGASHMAPKFSDGIPLPAIIASVSMGLWLADMWRHRHYLKTHAAN